MSVDTSTFDPWKVLSYVWASLAAIFLWVFRRGVKNFDEIEDKIESFVTRDEFSSRLDQLHGDRMRMHAENLEAMREIRGSIERVHSRVDEVFTRQDRRPRR